MSEAREEAAFDESVFDTADGDAKPEAEAEGARPGGDPPAKEPARADRGHRQENRLVRQGRLEGRPGRLD
jgi:hypothetical protein